MKPYAGYIQKGEEELAIHHHRNNVKIINNRKEDMHDRLEASIIKPSSRASSKNQ